MTKKVPKGVGAQEPAIIFMLGGGDDAKLVESSVCTRNIVSSQESKRPRTVAPIHIYRLVEVWNQRPGASGLLNVVATGPQQHHSIPVLLFWFDTAFVLLAAPIATQSYYWYLFGLVFNYREISRIELVLNAALASVSTHLGIFIRGELDSIVREFSFLMQVCFEFRPQRQLAPEQCLAFQRSPPRKRSRIPCLNSAVTQFCQLQAPSSIACCLMTFTNSLARSSPRDHAMTSLQVLRHCIDMSTVAKTALQCIVHVLYAKTSSVAPTDIELAPPLPCYSNFAGIKHLSTMNERGTGVRHGEKPKTCRV